ncbi:hypothetical protein Tco_0935724 [Tanacetum coccineum]
MFPSLCPSVSGWYVVLMSRLVPKAFWSDFQKFDVNLGSRSQMIETRIPCLATTSFRDLEAAFEYPGERYEGVEVCETFYACSDSLLLTPLCCDDIHDVTPRVSALAGCDRLVSEPLVIENYVSLIRKKFCWGTIFPIGLKRYRDPKEEPIEKEPLMELKEIGIDLRIWLSSVERVHEEDIPKTAFRTRLCTHAKRQGREHDNKNAVWPGPTNGKEGRGGMYLLWVPLIGDVRTLMMDEAHASSYTGRLQDEKLARTYIDETVARHGVALSIISDCDGRFTSRFW